MAQIAKAAGVSQGAISSLLNDRDYGIRVSDKTRERVFKVCREMGYIPNDLRAVVRMYPELGDFCLLFSASIAGGVTHPFLGRIIQGAMSAVTDPSHPITIGTYTDQADYGHADPDNLPHPIRAGVASKLMCFGTPNLSLIHMLLRRGSPVVSLGTDVPVAGVLSLVPDYAMAAQLAVEHLFKLGHEHLAIVSGPFGTTDQQTLELHRGVKLAYDDLGISIDAQNIVYGDLSYAAGASALDNLLGHPVKPTAILCLSDAAAAGVLMQALSRGIRVPEQLSVVGCGDDFCSSMVIPGLTTAHLPAEEMARVGIHEIERLVREPLATEPRKQILAVRLIERASSGPVPPKLG
ncbi:MAG: LacI family DNA-binding transcriptional regulator [Chthoniobacteraceae bacterium]